MDSKQTIKESMEEYDSNLLKDPLCIGDLIGPSGTKFEMNTDFDEGFIHDIHDELFENEELKVELEPHKLASPWLKPFAELKLQMIKIDNFLHKRIIVNGNIEAGLMPEKSRVCIRYNAYMEGVCEPFDSTYLRGTSFTFYTGQFTVLEGLERAVRTMYIGEQAQFIISYHLLFGEMGCPPRVHPKGDGLFIIELVSFNAVGDIDATDNIPEEDRNKFAIVVEKVKEIHLKGVDFFKQGLYRYAVRAFEKAVDVLSFCQLKNEDEEKEQTAFLIKLYMNLAVCYNKLSLYSRTCTMVNQINKLTCNNPPCKAIFQEGKALLQLGEYKKAKTLLLRAQRMEPKNAEISKALETLESRQKTYSANEKLIWQKALGMQKQNENMEPDTNTSEFEENMLTLLKEFKNCSINDKIKLPLGLTKAEINTVDELAKSLDMTLEFSPLDNSHSIRKK